METARPVTGVTLFNEDGFVHLLKGASDAVRATLERIVVDPRHEGLDILFDRSDTDRRCPA